MPLQLNHPNYMLQIWTQQHASMQASLIPLYLSSLPGKAWKIIIDITVMSRAPTHPSSHSSLAAVWMSRVVQLQESLDAKWEYVTRWGAGQTTVPSHALITPYNTP